MAKSADKLQRELLDEMFSGKGSVYTCMKGDEISPREPEPVTCKLSNTRKHVNPDGNWGIVVVPGEEPHCTNAGKIAALYDYVGAMPDGISKILCLSDDNVRDSAQSIAERFLESGGQVLYDGNGILSCGVSCEMSWFSVRRSFPYDELHYSGPVQGKLEEVLVGQALADIVYDAMDDIASEYVDCGAEIGAEEAFEVTKILSYGRCDLVADACMLSWDEDIYFDAVIDNWGDDQREKLKVGYKSKVESALGLAKIWKHFSDRYSFSLFGYDEAAFWKWAEMGELLGIKDAVLLHYDHGVPIRDILA